MNKVDACYNWQWGRNAQVDEELLDFMREHGYAAQHTGGGCMAWEKTLEDADERYVMITVDGVELGKWEDRDKAEWQVGIYTVEGDGWTLAYPFHTLADAVKIAEVLPWPNSGDAIEIRDSAVLLHADPEALRKARKLAKAFEAKLRAGLTDEQYAEMLRRNQTPEYATCCASHDFCDANMVMFDAWVECFGSEPELESDRDTAIWNQAWDLAIKLYMGINRRGSSSDPGEALKGAE